MKEIGGYFGLEQLVSNEYYSELVAVNNARNALLYLLKARGIRKLYIPYFICDSVSMLCDREGYPYEFYSIDREFLPVFDRKLLEGEYLYIVNYYGQLDNIYISELKERYKNIIVDNVQAFFQDPVDGVDTIYSCRKFFGVPDGAYLATDAQWQGQLPADNSKNRMKHLLGRFEDGTASAYYADFKANDHAFRETELRAMSAITHNILGAIDYEAVRKRREENYGVLHRALRRKNRLNICQPTGPYAYPFYCEKGMNVKEKLAEQNIYVATLWPNVLDLEGTHEKDFAENILPLPCDQRYTEEDMAYMIQVIMNCIE